MSRKTPSALLAFSMMLAVSLLPPAALAQNSTASTADKVMAGFPPDAESRVNYRNAMRLPYLRWTMQHARERTPTKGIRHSDNPMMLVAGAALPVNDIRLNIDGRTVSMPEHLRATNTDGLLVLHDGKVVYEQYFGTFTARDSHIWASMTKSMTGIVAGVMAAEGRFDFDRSLAHYVPELQDSPFGKATVQKNMDMEVALKYPPKFPPDIGLFMAAGIIPYHEGGPKSIYDYLMMPTAATVEGPVWFYQNGSAEAVGWALKKAAHEDWASLVENLVWSRFADDDAAVMVGPLTAEMASGGMNSTLRDLARFGEAVRRGWSSSNPDDPFASGVKRVLGQHDNRELFAKGNKAAGHPGYSYHDFWWHRNNDSGAVVAQGRFGQYLYIDPVHRLVVAKFSSNPDSAKRVSGPRAESMKKGDAKQSTPAFDVLMDAIVARLPD